MVFNSYEGKREDSKRKEEERYNCLLYTSDIMKPRLVISENKEPKVYSKAINKENLEELISCFGAVINDEDGTGNLGKINGCLLYTSRCV